MEFSFGTLELNRTNPAHIGTKQISETVIPVTYSIQENGKILPLKKIDQDIHGTQITRSGDSNKPSFQNYLLDAMNQVNSRQMEVSNLQKQVITDPDSVDIHDVTSAMAKARMSLDLAQTVIQRLVDGWNEISQNR